MLSVQLDNVVLANVPGGKGKETRRADVASMRYEDDPVAIPNAKATAD